MEREAEANIRLECLKLATARDDFDALSVEEVIEAAAKMATFVLAEDVYDGNIPF